MFCHRFAARCRGLPSLETALACGNNGGDWRDGHQPAIREHFAPLFRSAAGLWIDRVRRDAGRAVEHGRFKARFQIGAYPGAHGQHPCDTQSHLGLFHIVLPALLLGHSDRPITTTPDRA